MLRIRVMGKQEDIDWIMNVLEKNKQIRVLQKTEKMRLRGSNRFFRSYIQVERSTMEGEK